MIMSALWKKIVLFGVVIAEIIGWVATAIGLSFTTMEFVGNGAPISSVLPVIPLYLTAGVQPLALLVILPSICPLACTDRSNRQWNKCFIAVFNSCFLFIATLSVCYILVQALLYPPFHLDTTSVISLSGTGITIISHAVLTLNAVCCVFQQTTDEKTKLDDDDNNSSSNEKIHLIHFSA